MDSAQEFSEFYSRRYEAVLRYAMRRCDPETARDVAADTFLVAWRRRAAVPADPGQHEPWLYGVARRVLANAERSQRRADRLAAKLGHEERSANAPDPAMIFAENARLKHALASMSARDQEALRLIGWEGLDLAAAALAMGCTRTAMAVRLHRARRRLEDAFGGAEWETRKATLTGHVPSQTISQETQ
jgi:RNA polymerase sigma-70 factor, ECF subfamily